MSREYDLPFSPYNLLRPTTIAQALQLLAENGDRAVIIGGATIPPAGLESDTILIDVGGIFELSGIHQMAGRLVIGMNATHAELAHASLIRSRATCLAEACELDEDPFGATLAHDLRPRDSYSDVLLSLATLEAEVEIARLGSSDSVERTWLPLSDVWGKSPAGETKLLLAAGFAAGNRSSGSALISATPPAGTSTTVRAAGAHVGLDADGETVATVRVFVNPAVGPPIGSETAASLIGLTLEPDVIEAAARAVQADIVDQLPAQSAEREYHIDLVAHLVRQALDRAAARARAPAGV